MYLKKLSLVAIMLLTVSCDDIDPDQTLIDCLWTKTIEVIGIGAGTPKPEIVMLEEDLNHAISLLNCESESGKSKGTCLTERKEAEDSVLIKTGKKYQSRYEKYIQADRNFINEDCEKYSDKESRNQCGTDKPSRQADMMALGRAFLADDYIEIYHRNIYKSIWGHLDHALISNARKESVFYSVIAHEMLHVALYKKNIDANDHHRLMRDKYMDPLINFISDYKKIPHDGFHRKLTYGSLEAGITGDEEWKRINDRKNSRKLREKNEIPVLPCGLRLR